MIKRADKDRYVTYEDIVATFAISLSCMSSVIRPFNTNR